MSSSTGLNTVRSGVQLLSAVMKEADAEGDGNRRVSSREIRDFLDSYGDGGSMDAAVKRMFAYAQNVAQSTSPAITDVNKALGKAMQYIARAADGSSLSPAEYAGLAKTWKSVVKFARDYKGNSIDDILAVDD